MSHSDFFAHLLFAVVPLAVVWGIGRESYPGMINWLQRHQRQAAQGQQLTVNHLTRRNNVDFGARILITLALVAIGMLITDRLVTAWLPDLAMASAYPAPPPLLLTIILTLVCASLAYAMWFCVALITNKRQSHR